MIDYIRTIWKQRSVKLAAFVGVVTGLLTANYGLLLGLIQLIPNGPLKWLVGALVGFVVFIVPALTQQHDIKKATGDGQ